MEVPRWRRRRRARLRSPWPRRPRSQRRRCRALAVWLRVWGGAEHPTFCPRVTIPTGGHGRGAYCRQGLGGSGAPPGEGGQGEEHQQHGEDAAEEGNPLQARRVCHPTPGACWATPGPGGGGGELDEVGEGELAHIWRLIWPPAQTHEYECRCACAYMHACVCACARVYVLIHTHMQRRWPMLEGTANTLFAIVPFFFPSCIQGKIMRPLPFHPGFTFFSFCFIWWSSFFAS